MLRFNMLHLDIPWELRPDVQWMLYSRSEDESRHSIKEVQLWHGYSWVANPSTSWDRCEARSVMVISIFETKDDCFHLKQYSWGLNSIHQSQRWNRALVEIQWDQEQTAWTDMLQCDMGIDDSREMKISARFLPGWRHHGHTTRREAIVVPHIRRARST